MTDTGRNVTGDQRGSASRFDGLTSGRDERRGPDRPQGDSRLPAHIMAAVRETIRAAAATCVAPARLESSGPYEWLALVEQHDDELYQLVRRYIESCRYLDDLEHRGDGLGMSRARLNEAVRNASFARESMRASLVDAIAQRAGGGLADV
jgi:hypothetical protein